MLFLSLSALLALPSPVRAQTTMDASMQIQVQRFNVIFVVEQFFLSVSRARTDDDGCLDADTGSSGPVFPHSRRS